MGASCSTWGHADVGGVFLIVYRWRSCWLQHVRRLSYLLVGLNKFISCCSLIAAAAVAAVTLLVVPRSGPRHGDQSYPLEPRVSA
jgi:hypothetical protein